MTAVNDDLDKIARDEADLAARKARLGVDQPESPTVIDVDADGNVTAPSTAVVVPDEPEPWPHEVLRDFYGEDWEVRQPSEQALAAFALSSGKYIPQKLQNDLVGLFIKQHMSEAAHERVYVRLMDPEDPSFTPQTLGELMREIATLGRDSAGE